MTQTQDTEMDEYGPVPPGNGDDELELLENEEDSGPLPLTSEDDLLRPGTPPSPLLQPMVVDNEPAVVPRQTPASFARLTRQKTDAALTPGTPTPASKGKGRAAASLPPPPPAPSAATGSASASGRATLEVALQSTLVNNDQAKSNIQALKKDVKAIAQYFDRGARIAAADRESHRSALLALTTTVDSFNDRLPPAGAYRALQDRVERMDQRTESNDDRRGREIADLEDRSNTAYDDNRSVITRLDGLSSAVDSLRTDVAALISNRGSNASNRRRSASPSAFNRNSNQPASRGPDRTFGSRSNDRAFGNRSNDRAPFNSRNNERSLDKGKQPNGPVPLRGPSPGPSSQRGRAPASNSVRLGNAQWSSDPEQLRRDFNASVRAVWDAIPGLENNITSLTLDNANPAYVIVRFTAAPYAKAFHDGWVENKHNAGRMQSMRASFV